MLFFRLGSAPLAKLRTALLFMSGNFVGPEYYWHLVRADRRPDLVCHVGKIGEDSVAWERWRTGGLWNPPPLPESQPIKSFATLRDPALLDLLLREQIDVCIQAGIGILKGGLLRVPRIGWINVHPGKLPEYRGNACPEWAVFHGDDVIATAHLIDDGIDTGPVIVARRYAYQKGGGYHRFRAGIYAHCAQVLIDALDRLEITGAHDLSSVLSPQTEAGAMYRPKLPDDVLAVVIAKLNGQVAPGANQKASL